MVIMRPNMLRQYILEGRESEVLSKKKQVVFELSWFSHSSRMLLQIRAVIPQIQQRGERSGPGQG